MLFVQTPVFKKAIDTDSFDESIALKPLPALVVSINISGFALHFYRSSYALIALSLLLVFYPFILNQPFWLLGLILCWSGLWLAHRREIDACVTGTLSYSDQYWQFEQNGCTCRLELAGEVLCWSWLIILPLRETETAKSRRLLIFSDALNKEDNASLRRWLRACLIPKA